MAAGNLLVKPMPAPGTKGEARSRRASGSGRKGRRRTKGWLKLSKGERGGKLPARSGRVSVATYTIQDGRSEGVLSTARALDHVNVDVAEVQEVKLKDHKLAPRTGFGYQIHTTAAGTDNCGGISLLVKEDGSFRVEEVKVWEPNVLSFQLQVGEETEDRWHCVGRYLGVLQLDCRSVRRTRNIN